MLCALALVLGLGLQMGMVPTASAATGPVGNDFVVTGGNTLTSTFPCGAVNCP